MCPVASFLGRVLAPSASSTCSLQCPDRKVLDPRVPSPQHTALAVPTEHGHVGGDLALPGVLNRQLWGPHPKPSQRQATTPVHLGNTPSAGQLHPPAQANFQGSWETPTMGGWRGEPAQQSTWEGKLVPVPTCRVLHWRAGFSWGEPPESPQGVSWVTQAGKKSHVPQAQDKGSGTSASVH